MDSDDIEAVSRQIYPLLHGQNPLLVGAVLIDLVSMWLAGHVSVAESGNEEESLKYTRELRQQLLSDFIIAVEAMVPVNAKEIGNLHDPKELIALKDHNPFKRN